MKQYGDIKRISGEILEPVDLIVGGSPCQNLSLAGNRQGLEGSESGLFYEMVRIIKQMRKATNGNYPRYVLWENVPGAFSSNDGRDFAAVLTEFIRILEPKSPDVPCPQEGWPKAGIIFLPLGSLAWRTHDAQLWGVPQRRRRISLVLDLRGSSAPEVLFEPKELPRDHQQSQTAGKNPTRTAAESTGIPGGNNSVEREREREQFRFKSDLVSPAGAKES